VTLVEQLRRLSEVAQIQRALCDGKTIAQIVAECGVTANKVRIQRVLLGKALTDNRRTATKARVIELTERGWTAREIAGKLCITCSAVYHHRRRIK
jgi:DNA-binding NarL/FixJ family response regulator